MNKKLRISAAAAGIMALALISFPTGSKASEEGTRNTAYALGAATVYFMLNKRPTESLLGAAATGVALHELQRKINARHEREKQQAVAAARQQAVRSSGGGSAASRTVSAGGGGSANTAAVYDRGVSDGCRKGYEFGHAAGIEVGYERGRQAALREIGIQQRQLQMNGGSSNTLGRVLLARR